ncbi:MAG: hypothetical protein LBP59_07805 [Planctomycetaceae bacterium]|nr:hypothetical protein [Planctomycetaceae bacterium]
MLQKIVRRIAGVSPACGCTQPLAMKVLIPIALLVALRQHAAETATFLLNFLLQKNIPLVPHVPFVPQKLPKRNLIKKYRKRLLQNLNERKKLKCVIKIFHVECFYKALDLLFRRLWFCLRLYLAMSKRRRRASVLLMLISDSVIKAGILHECLTT